MSRIAVGDLLIDLDFPDHLSRSYEESGALVVWDQPGHFAIRVSGITVRGKDPKARNLCVTSCEDDARAKNAEFVSLTKTLCFYRENKTSEWPTGLGTSEFWMVGFGNRRLVVTLSYLESEKALIDLRSLRDIVESAIRSVALTHPLAREKSDELDIFDLADSQRPWLENHRVEMARRVRLLTGYDGNLIPLEALDEYWAKFLAAPPASNNELNAILNGVGVIFGDHLVRAKAFEWIVLSDSYGVCIAIAALRGTANLNVDPFNFVAKRWERKETPFLRSGFQSISQMADEHAAQWGANTRQTTNPNSPVKQPWWKFGK